ncbi:MAG: hypothetical protein EOO24_02120 [Comamonadaceae bacterium]|nr:MAG: hypothetical protein EOO24_02120 [Comamonadaceae bacterium]
MTSKPLASHAARRRSIRSPLAGRRSMRGQALTESVIALLAVLIPLFVFGWALNGYATARNTAVSAARYAAWERTVWFAQAPTDSPLTGANKVVKTGDRIQAEMIDRVFQRARGPSGQPDAIRSSNAAPPAARNSALSASLQTYRGGSDNVLEVESTRPRDAHSGERPRLALADSGVGTSTGVVGTLEAIGKVTSKLSGSKPIDLENRGLWKADVTLRTNGLNIAALGDGAMTHLPALNFTESAAVMTNGWNVGGHEHEISRVKTMVPLSVADTPFFDTLLDVLGFLVPPLGDWEPGYVDPDRLPTDRRR